jgi:hypothetical protein
LYTTLTASLYAEKTWIDMMLMAGLRHAASVVDGSAKFGTPAVSSWLAGNFTIKMEVFTGKIMENHRTRWVMFQPCLITRGNPQFTALHTTLDHSIPVASVALAMNHPSNQPDKKKGGHFASQVAGVLTS